MRDTHTNFQLPASKTDLTYNRSEMGAILPLKTLPLRGGDGVNFSESTSYERPFLGWGAQCVQKADFWKVFICNPNLSY